MVASIESRNRSAQENSEANMAIPIRNNGTPPGPGSQPTAPEARTKSMPKTSTVGRRTDRGVRRQPERILSIVRLYSNLKQNDLLEVTISNRSDNQG